MTNEETKQEIIKEIDSLPDYVADLMLQHILFMIRASRVVGEIGQLKGGEKAIENMNQRIEP